MALKLVREEGTEKRFVKRPPTTATTFVVEALSRLMGKQLGEDLLQTALLIAFCWK